MRLKLRERLKEKKKFEKSKPPITQNSQRKKGGTNGGPIDQG